MKFQEMATKTLFLSFQNSFSATFFQYLNKQNDESSSLTTLWNYN